MNPSKFSIDKKKYREYQISNSLFSYLFFPLSWLHLHFHHLLCPLERKRWLNQVSNESSTRYKDYIRENQENMRICAQFLWYTKGKLRSILICFSYSRFLNSRVIIFFPHEHTKRKWYEKWSIYEKKIKSKI